MEFSSHFVHLQFILQRVLVMTDRQNDSDQKHKKLG